VIDLEAAFYTCAIIMFLGGFACGAVAFGARRYPEPPVDLFPALRPYMESVDWYPGIDLAMYKRLKTLPEMAADGANMIRVLEALKRVEEMA
jgi:hypothetical protein